MSIIIKTEKAIAQPKSFNSLLDSVRQQQSLTNDIHIFDQLDIAEGLKELLIIHNFRLELLQRTSPNDLAQILGIDEYIARIIIQSVNPSWTWLFDKNWEAIKSNK